MQAREGEVVPTADPSGVLRDVGCRVRDLREALGLSQEALADKAGLHRTYVGSLERGQRNVSVLNLYALAAALNEEPGHLLPFTSSPTI